MLHKQGGICCLGPEQRTRAEGKQLSVWGAAVHPLLVVSMPVSSLGLELVFTVNNNIKEKFDSDGFAWEGGDVKAFITLASGLFLPSLLFPGYLAALNRAA